MSSSAARKSAARWDSPQVTLVLDNTEHIFPRMEESEVAVTRRYYRSGESEYYINKPERAPART